MFENIKPMDIEKRSFAQAPGGGSQDGLRAVSSEQAEGRSRKGAAVLILFQPVNFSVNQLVGDAPAVVDHQLHHGNVLPSIFRPYVSL